MMHAPDDNSPQRSQQQTRVVLLGASNLTRGLPIVVDTVRCAFSRALDIRAAIGHGRSYGRRSRVLCRSLPGILDCGLWDSLNAAPPAARTVALISDVGNDIIYGETVTTIVDWVRTALDRLEAHNAEVVMTSLPIASISAAPRWQAQLAKMITYPGAGPSVDEAITLAGQVNTAIAELAGQRRAAFIEQPAEWYGFDPIHIRRSHWPTAAAAMLAPLGNGAAVAPVRRSLRGWWHVRTARPKQMTFAGIALESKQPARRFDDDATLSLY